MDTADDKSGRKCIRRRKRSSSLDDVLLLQIFSCQLSLTYFFCSGNIPGDRIDQGELLCDYIQPLPLKGTGYHRMVFVLFKQEKRLDFSRSRLPQPWYYRPTVAS